MQRITDTYLPMLKTATTIEDQERIEDTASAEMNRVVENHGMTVTRFTQILELTKVSPELADRVRWHVHESQAVGAYLFKCPARLVRVAVKTLPRRGGWNRFVGN